MKSALLTFLLFCCLPPVFAQAPADQRTTTTKIADLLARMPAQGSDAFQASMESIESLGEKGLTEMALMLAAPGKGDNTALEYAMGSYSYYTTGKGREALRSTAVRSYMAALEKMSAPENKAFIIRQLTITGMENSITALSPYLHDERLCDPAARALVKIHTAGAGQALLYALSTASGSCLPTLVEACGDMRYAPAAAFIGKLAESGTDKAVIKLSLFALAGIGDPASETILASAAEKSGYVYEVTGAMTAYLDYLQRLTANGHGAQAEKGCVQLMKVSNRVDQVATHTAALQLLVVMQGARSEALLIKAMSDPYPSYRKAALKYALLFPGEETTALWLKKLKEEKKDNEKKCEMIEMLGDSRQSSALPAMLEALKDRDTAVRLRAIAAAAKIGQMEALPALLEVMKKNDSSEINAVKNVLLVMKGKDLTGRLGSALSSMPSSGKAALLEVLAARAADDQVAIVLPLAKSPDPVVSHAALAALKDLSTPATLPELFTLLLNAGSPAEIRALQEAIVAASKGTADSATRTATVLAAMKQAPPEKQPLFYEILAGIGGRESLRVVSQAFSSSPAAVVSALSDWPDASATNALFVICQDPAAGVYFDQALAGILRLVSRSSYPDEEKLLLYRRAMDLAKTTGQQQSILEEIGDCKTFIALIVAGRYLDTAELQQPAATAVMTIALSHPEWNGAAIRQLLEKTISVLQGKDAEYQKQGLRKYLVEMPAGDGLAPMFNGRDLEGWKGLVGNPIERAKMNADTLRMRQARADEAMRQNWTASKGNLEFSGNGENLCTVKKYGDFEMFVDWKIDPDGDAGIYLRGSPQVQIWDTSRRDVGAQVGSGGLYNNAVYESKPLVLADNAIGEWNNFHIIMRGDRVTVYLNGVLVVNNIILENYWDRNLPIFPEEQIELQAHGRHVSYRDLYIREFPRTVAYTLPEEEKKDGFQLLFDGTNMYQWTGNTTEYVIEDGSIAIHPKDGNHGNLYTKKEYQDFAYRFDFQLTPGANNGIGIRAPLEGDAAYVGMEIQVLDNEADIYRNLHVYQYHGSVYGVIPAKRGYLKPVGEWNQEEIVAVGHHIKVTLNGTVILDGDISDAIKNGTLDGKEHPGLQNVKGHLGFLGHGDVVRFRHMRVKDLSEAASASPVKKKKSR